MLTNDTSLPIVTSMQHSSIMDFLRHAAQKKSGNLYTSPMGNDWVAHVVDRSNRWKERKIKESVYIRTRRTYYMDSGSSLSPVWNSLIRI